MSILNRFKAGKYKSTQASSFWLDRDFDSKWAKKKKKKRDSIKNKGGAPKAGGIFFLCYFRNI